MNVSQISQQQTTVIDFISSTGQQKVLTSLAGTETVRAIRAEALTSLSYYQCTVCKELHSKPLQTRCCEAILCALCYNQLGTLEKCPNDGKAFTNPSVDLKPMGRAVNNQIEHLLGHFTHIEATGIDFIKGEAQRIALAALEGQPASGTAIPEPSCPVSSVPGLNSGTMVGIHERAANYQVREIALGLIKSIDIRTCQGNIVLTEQAPQRQDAVSVIASTDPELLFGSYLLIAPRGNNNDHDVTVKLPKAFAQPLEIRSDTGDVTTGNGYWIKHGGLISTQTGNIRIAVDSSRVKDEIVGPDSDVTVSNHDELPGHQTKLFLRAMAGKINVTY
ncbi:hypothetical protein [Endozoicomonas sp. YOMI1]|uniref:hypothetical protein n=1 Tax=Endozoicomonas sp. YOMI1 TaxID=2828739 RepID=UPI0021480902|nr:hypothetical protein [Endozoicomonas sp. YOMI1]